MFGLTSLCCTGSPPAPRVNSSLYLMSVLQIERVLVFKKGEEKKKKRNLMKHSAGQPQRWENNRQITRGGGKGERGENKEDRRGDGRGGGRKRELQLNIS